jgi:hypothetical protein
MRLTLAALLSAIVLWGVACATVQAPVVIPDAKTLAGRWEGNLVNARGDYFPVLLEIREDGTYNAVTTTTTPPQNFPGTFKVVAGKAQTLADRGVTGAWTLYDRGGTPALYVENNQGVRGEFRRAR